MLSPYMTIGGWQPTGATPAPLIPVWCRCIPACGLSGVE